MAGATAPRSPRGRQQHGARLGAVCRRRHRVARGRPDARAVAGSRPAARLAPCRGRCAVLHLRSRSHAGLQPWLVWTVIVDGLMCALIVGWAMTRETRLRALRAVGVSAVLTALFGMWQAITGLGLQTAWIVFDAGIIRINATYIDPNALAAFYALVAPGAGRTGHAGDRVAAGRLECRRRAGAGRRGDDGRSGRTRRPGRRPAGNGLGGTAARTRRDRRVDARAASFPGSGARDPADAGGRVAAARRRRQRVQRATRTADLVPAHVALHVQPAPARRCHRLCP